MVHSAGCGYHGLDPLACCPQHQAASSHTSSRSSRFAPNDRWVWDTSSGSKRSPRFNYSLNRFVAHETEMRLHDYWDFEAQRNCPQPIEDDYDDHHPFGFGSGHHFQYHIDHEIEPVEKAPRPKPADRPIVFPGDLRFQESIEIRGEGELMADASQEQIIRDTTPTTTMTPMSTTTATISPAARMNSPNCGISVSTRLLGGDEVAPGQYPWFARIAYRNRTNNRISYRCSGSLISNNYVLTAAHCVVNLVSDLQIFQVRIGDDVSGAQDCSPTAANCSRPNIFDIVSVLVHPNYDQPKYANDIALLRLNNSLSNFTPICLPLNSTAALADRLIGQMGVVAGWSTKMESMLLKSNTSSSPASSTASVRFIRLPIVNTTSCAITYATLSENFQQPIVITPSHLCAQGQPMKDVCRGDSGGPFMDDGTSGILNANGRHTLLGIVAFGPTLCGVTTVPGVYTAVSSYMNWIFDSINEFYFPNEANQVPNYGRCITPNRERALCIHLEDCKYLYGVLTTTPLRDADKLYLSRSQCGYFNQKVLICCPDRYRDSTPATTARPPANKTNTNLLPLPGQCGNILSNRIYGGVKTKIDEFPWMALIEYTKGSGNKGHHCGGSLISTRYVVTASHCVNGRSLPADWRLTGVRLGEWDTATDPDCEVDVRGIKDCAPPHMDVPVERAIPHPSYDPGSKNQVNDIALLRMARQIEYTDFVRPICLPLDTNLRSATFDGISMDVAGWGKTEELSASNLKLKAAVDGFTLEECQSVYSRQSIVLENTQMCAGGMEGVDSCRGDSGGPLIGLDTNKVNTYYFLAGVVSFGPTPCGLNGWPGVYSRVGAYVDWIQSTLEQ
ncbi:transmembrane protease serine 9 [Drosophila novamexicana]|uniref:transmembrane protease serine 9 n=1 Tax=Drosophila novamexicana TaxID=47314 RepID=UPI0011E604A3|nr:transmembrane protease serine 9 [Drosophila novamexicana]